MDELKEIKKLYGEDMMHVCREMFPSLLEKPGLLVSILKENIAPSHLLAKDIIDNHNENIFREYIYSFIKKQDLDKTTTNKTPFELMDEAGYTLYECKSEEDIQSFKKYYAPNEVICTIYMGGRLDRCHVFFAVKKNVDEIKREDFDNPQREDEYGTSVISIQFAKGNNNFISIKNRYNHAVDKPDSTFSNDLEKIIPGLTNSFEKYYGFAIKNSFDEPSNEIEEIGPYIKANDGKWYRYNIESDAIYYCENNIIIMDGRVIKSFANHPERYIFADNYVIDNKEKKIIQIYKFKKDSFIESIDGIGKIKRIYVTKNDDEKIITIVYEDQKEIKIKINRSNNIVGYYNDYVEHIDKFFLQACEYIEEISLSNVKDIGDNFLLSGDKIKKISLPNVEKIGKNFLFMNNILDSISLPSVRIIGEDFLKINKTIEAISLPNVQKIGNNFLYFNKNIKGVSLPNLEIIGDGFLYWSTLESVHLPKVKEIGDYFLYHNEVLKELSLPNVKTIGNSCLHENKVLERLSLPSVEEIGDNFLYKNRELEKISLPKVKKIGLDFLTSNYGLKELDVSQLEEIGNNFLDSNIKLKEISLPNVEIIPNNFLCGAELEKVSLPNVKEIGNKFLYSNYTLKKLSLPKVETIGNGFMSINKSLRFFFAPRLKNYGTEFLPVNQFVHKLYRYKNDEKLSDQRSR